MEAADKRLDNLADMKVFCGFWRRAFICAPYDPEADRSWEKRWWYCRFALDHHCIPVAPELYYPLFMLYEQDQKEKYLADGFALKDLLDCDEVWVFGKVFTPLMERAMKIAGRRGMVVRFFPDWEEAQEEYCREDSENE